MENVLVLKNSKRFAYIDVVRCLGILIVINGHVQLYGMDIEAYASPSTLMLYSFNMPLFFFVSGYLAYKGKEIGKVGELKKIGKKFLYLVIPAFIFYEFYTLRHNGYILGFVENGLGEYWFTFTLFEMFVIYYIVNAISKCQIFLVVILALLSIVGVGYLSFFSKCDIAFWDFNHLAKYFQFFTIGVFAKMFTHQYDKLMRNEGLKAFSMVSFFFLLFSLYQIDMPNIVFHFFRDIVLRYLGLYIVMSLFYCNQDLFNRNNKLNSLILKIGQNSLAIYLLQYFFMPNLTVYPKWLDGFDWLSIYVICFVYTVFITALCMIFIELLSNSILVKKYILGRK